MEKGFVGKFRRRIVVEKGFVGKFRRRIVVKRIEERNNSVSD